MPTSTPKFLTLEQFKLACLHLKNVSQKRRDIAQKVLVDKVRPSIVATDYGVSRQVVSSNTRRVLDAYLFDLTLAKARDKIQSVSYVSESPPPRGMFTPSGWEHVSILAPSPLIQQLKIDIENYTS